MESLRTNGYLLVSSKNTQKSLEGILLPILPKGYKFLTYKYSIHGAALSTYHRDVTSSQSSLQTKYPTYTVIHYAYKGDFLSVSPGSHRQWQFSLPTTLRGQTDTVLLFNCDLVHAGIDAPPGIQRIATQYKIAHEDDFPRLEELHGVDVVQEGKPVGALLNVLFRVGSYIFLVPIEFFCRHLLQRKYASGLGAWLQRRVPFGYFNNPDGHYTKV